MQFPWTAVTILLAIATACLCVADSELNGSFQDSSVGTFLTDAGVTDKVSEFQKGVVRKVNDLVGDQTVVELIQKARAYVIELDIYNHILDFCNHGFSSVSDAISSLR